MSTLLIVLLVFGGIALYGFIGGFAGEANIRWRKYARANKKFGGGDSYMDGEARTVAAVLWPLILVLAPIVIGTSAAGFIFPAKRGARRFSVARTRLTMPSWSS